MVMALQSRILEPDIFKSIVKNAPLVSIDLCLIHALENPGDNNLEFIEVQCGSYLGEDDIVRFEDNYGRVKN